MSYLVMETHPAYAVVLDEDGRFLKAANLRYQVGDRVQSIVELRRPKEAHRRLWKPLSGAAGLAACVCLVFFGWYQPNFAPYGALRIQINPDVELTLSRTDRVLELEGLNADGEDLIAGYDFQGKDREEATEDLMERAIDMGYLSSGDTVAITVTSSDADWQAQGKSVISALGPLRTIFFTLTFFTIGMVSNFRKLMEEGIGKLAIVYVVCLFGFIIWLGLFISWLFFHGMTPPVVAA